ncbi:Shikimate kinase [Bienertia sinuspersici]
MSSSASTSRKKARKAKNAAGNRTNPGWEHGFEVEGDPTMVKCKYCGVVRGGGIYRHKHHLTGTRSNVEPCLQVPDEVKLNFRQLLEANAQKSNEKRKKINDIGEEEENYEYKRERGCMDTFVTKGKPGLQTTLNQKYKKEERVDVCQQITRFFYTCAIPLMLSTILNFQSMLKRLLGMVLVLNLLVIIKLGSNF